MSIRWRNGKPIVEVYDPALKRKRHVKPRDYGVSFYGTEKMMLRQAKVLEAKALEAVEEQRPSGDTTVEVFAGRWLRDYPRSEQTNMVYEERCRTFVEDFGKRTMRSISRAEVREWASDQADSRITPIKAMFADALNEGLVDFNPFSRMRVAKKKGRRDIVVLTKDEVHELAALAVETLSPAVGPEMQAMILFAAYTCMRPGEVYASRYSCLVDDIYDLRVQYNSKLRREAEPKHGSVGKIFVPEPARIAVLEKPRRLGDDLMFRTERGRQFSTQSMNYHWNKVTAAARRPALDFYELRHFGASYMLNELEMEPWVIAQQLRHTDGGKLVVTLYGHPDRRKALEIIRRTYEPPRPTGIAEIRERRAEHGA